MNSRYIPKIKQSFFLQHVSTLYKVICKMFAEYDKIKRAYITRMKIEIEKILKLKNGIARARDIDIQ